MAADVFGESFPFREEAEVIFPALEDAAKLCESISESKADNPTSKADDSPVTSKVFYEALIVVADFGAQFILVNAIRTKYPDDVIIAEEDLTILTSEQSCKLETFLGQAILSQNLYHPTPTTRRFWTIDPIDGTKGYLRGGQYAICIALVENEKVQLSFLACPRLPNKLSNEPGTIFFAVRSSGVLELDVNSKKYRQLGPDLLPFGNHRPILTESYESNHTDHKFSESFAHKLNLSDTLVRMDSQCKYGLVARGEANIYLRRPTRPGYKERIWDHAPGVLIVEMAGGSVTDFDGKQLVFAPNATLDRAGGILATNLGTTSSGHAPVDHSTVLSALHSIK